MKKREKILTMEDHPTEDNPGVPLGLPHDPQPAGAPGKQTDVNADPTTLPTHETLADDNTGK